MPLTSAHPVDNPSPCWPLTSCFPPSADSLHLGFHPPCGARAAVGLQRVHNLLSIFTSDSVAVIHDIDELLSVSRVNLEQVAALACSCVQTNSRSGSAVRTNS